MKKPYKTFITLYATLALFMAAPVFAAQAESPIPFGGYRNNGKCGCYGARTTIKTAAEARRIIEEFVVGLDLHIGTMEEKPRYFRVELIDSSGTVRDLVIVNKVNGRIRSAY